MTANGGKAKLTAMVCFSAAQGSGDKTVGRQDERNQHDCLTSGCIRSLHCEWVIGYFELKAVKAGVEPAL